MISKDQLYEMSVALLQALIAIPSFSREEALTAACLEKFLEQNNILSQRKGNNVWTKNKFFDPAKPSILLNSHHDTVKPNPGYQRDPFAPEIIDGKLYGLGSNDAGGALVSMLAAFMYYYEQQDLCYNLVFAASAEEEISGVNGIESLWRELPEIEFAIVGEPTLTEMAIAEKGLLVLDCVSTGKAGHAARNEGVNAIYEAMKDIQWFMNFRFPKTSEVLGEMKMSVTIINAGQAHNQIPAECSFAVDVRVTDAYSLDEILTIIHQNVSCQVTPRSKRLHPSGILHNHALVQAGVKLGKKLYGSPTTSDQALIPVPSVKIGPGDSARSHMADEFIHLHEIRDGIDMYIRLIGLLISKD